MVLAMKLPPALKERSVSATKNLLKERSVSATKKPAQGA
jgi:hypothetical protein